MILAVLTPLIKNRAGLKNPQICLETPLELSESVAVQEPQEMPSTALIALSLQLSEAFQNAMLLIIQPG